MGDEEGRQEMTDMELLELAAKAAGIRADEIDEHGVWTKESHDQVVSGWYFWNPLESDGAALRLAVKLRIQVPVIGNGMHADPYAATRRAIVRAAAATAEGAKE